MQKVFAHIVSCDEAAIKMMSDTSSLACAAQADFANSQAGFANSQAGFTYSYYYSISNARYR